MKSLPALVLAAACWGCLAGATGAQVLTTLSGSSMALKSQGSATLSSDGYLGTYLVVPAGGATVNFTVNATRGNGAANPNLNLSIADSNFPFNLSGAAPTNYTTANVTLPAGTYLLSAQRDYNANSAISTPFTLNDLSVNTINGSPVTFSNSSTATNALAAANTYIDNFRKGDATVTIKGPGNVPLLPGTPVNVNLGKLAFDFGGAVSGSAIGDPKDFTAPNPAAGSDIYKIQQFMNSNFKIIVPSNGGKWSNNEATQNHVTMQLVDEQLAYAQAHNMDARMHNLIWGKGATSGNQQPAWVNTLISRAAGGNSADKSALSAAITSRINYYVGTGGDRSQKYLNVDVLNEPVNNPSYLNIYGPAGIAAIYNQVAAAASAAGSSAIAFTNEYNVLQYSPASISSSGVESGSDQYANWYRNYVESIRNAGGSVGGVGMEYYVNPRATGNQVPSAATIQKALANLAVEGLPLSMDEFGMSGSVSQSSIQALGPQDMQDAMTMFFGTPGADEFLIWGWADIATNPTPPAALLDNKNGESLTPMGTRWEYMFNGSVVDPLKGGTNPDPWTTSAKTDADANGAIHFNGFYGSYYLNGQTAGNFDLDFVKGTSTYSIGMATPPNWSIWHAGMAGNWSADENWMNGGAANAPGQTAYFGPSSSATSVMIDVPQTVGMIVMESPASYTVGGTEPLSLQGFNNSDGHVAQIIVVSGNDFINAPLQLLDNTTISVQQPGSTLTVSDLQPSSAILTKNGPGLLRVNVLNVGGLIINGGSVQLTTNAQGSSVAELQISGGSTLDLGKSSLGINYIGGDDPAGSITAMVAAGYSHGNWNHSGIVSSAAALNPGTALGIEDNGSSVTVAYTWLGDANGDGTVTWADLQSMSAAGHTWQTGDFNYDGTVDADDYALFMLGLAASSGESIHNVPEPVIGLLALPAVLISTMKVGCLP